MMDKIIDLYYAFIDSDEYSELGDIPEVVKTSDDYYEFMEQFFKGESLYPVEHLIIKNNTANQIQGFYYGFLYASQLINEHCTKGGAFS